MAVTLDPRINVRKSLNRLFARSGLSLEMLAHQLDVTTSLLESYLSVEVVPDPSTYLKLRSALSKSPDEDRGMGLDQWYIALLAREQQKPQKRKRTSKINERHVIPAGEPDPLTAMSPKDLVEKLREVHRWALEPSLRELEGRTGHRLKRSTIGDMLHPNNTKLPRFDRYAIFLEACGVSDMSYWISAWRKFALPTRTPRGRMIEKSTLARYSILLEHRTRNEFLNAS
ncbi:hypothetical protein ACWCPM_30030 [Streptomyces sp. NPDC002309]